LGLLPASLVVRIVGRNVAGHFLRVQFAFDFTGGVQKICERYTKLFLQSTSPFGNFSPPYPYKLKGCGISTHFFQRLYKHFKLQFSQMSQSKAGHLAGKGGDTFQCSAEGSAAKYFGPPLVRGWAENPKKRTHFLYSSSVDESKQRADLMKEP
jgi:hypothetical protein